MNNFLVRGDLVNNLKDIYDLERLVSKINFGSCNGRDLLQLKKSLEIAPALVYNLRQLNSDYINSLPGMDFDFSELVATLEASISEEPPITVKEGGIFKHGYNQT